MSNNKTKTLNKLNCAPSSNSVGGYTCYSDIKLNLIKEMWNKRHPDKIIETNNPRKIWNFLKHQLINICDNEKCWLRQEFMKQGLDKELLHYTFAPEQPTTWKKNPTEWLSTLEIHKVLNQWEHKYNDFLFLGASPINYDTLLDDNKCVWDDLCNFNLKRELNNGKYKFGVIFNLDPHYKEGSHWVSLFINVKKREINYFDSYGIAPEKNIRKFINNIILQGKKLNINFKLNINNKRHQFSDSECGMYSIYFIIKMLKGTSFKYFINKRIKDNTMIKLRSKYFIPV